MMAAVMEEPLLLAGMIFLLTFVLEDAATITGALFAADGTLPVALALAALLAGIVLGDLGLYGLGMSARRWRFLRGVIRWQKVRRAQHYLRKRVVGTVLIARFLPGMRLPSFVAMGFFRFSFARFLLTVLVAAIVWTVGLFTAVYWIGATVLKGFEILRWVVGGALFLIILVLPRIVETIKTRHSSKEDKL